ncbi:DUF192 domain-containing protein [Acidocella facilis]|uniref:DUF192 domain-containing protein n=1 Tax=Acidocella facilis TaxID=525 RepID=UPI00047EEE1B|nr:DUF192 domain-containing protein [Acidocella facilis]
MKLFAYSLAASLLAGSMALAQPATDDPTGPQPKLPTQPLQIKTAAGKVFNFTVEIPKTQQQQDTGEMFRTDIPADSGMLFIWPQPQSTAMWMKNCPVPEDMVFIGADGKIVSIAEMTVPYSLKPIAPPAPVKAVLELQGGLTAKDDINVGDQVIAKPFPGS